MCGEYGPQRPNFWSILGPQISQHSGLWSFSKKFPTGCASVLVYMSIWATFRGVLNIGPRDPISWSNRSLFRSFYQTVSNAFTSFSFYMLIGGTSMCISIMCHKGSISGPRVKVAAELIVPSGLLNRKCDLLHYNVINFLFENVFCVTVPLWEESTRQRRISFTEGR